MYVIQSFNRVIIYSFDSIIQSDRAHRKQRRHSIAVYVSSALPAPPSSPRRAALACKPSQAAPESCVMKDTELEKL